MYSLVIDGKVVRTEKKAVYFKPEFYEALSEGKKVWIERDGKKVYFNGRIKKD